MYDEFEMLTLRGILPKEEKERLESYLFKVFERVGVSAEIRKLGENETLVFSYDKEHVDKLLGRGAGRREKFILLTCKEARSRMSAGESADDIAKEIGICRSTFFRRLKKAESNGYEYM